MPLVVPQLKTITLGGAVAGLGIESSSFRNGLPHESVRELEVLTGDGRVVVARHDNEHAGSANLDAHWDEAVAEVGAGTRQRLAAVPGRRAARFRAEPDPAPPGAVRQAARRRPVRAAAASRLGTTARMTRDGGGRRRREPRGRTFPPDQDQAAPLVQSTSDRLERLRFAAEVGACQGDVLTPTGWSRIISSTLSATVAYPSLRLSRRSVGVGPPAWRHHTRSHERPGLKPADRFVGMSPSLSSTYAAATRSHVESLGSAAMFIAELVKEVLIRRRRRGRGPTGGGGWWCGRCRVTG